MPALVEEKLEATATIETTKTYLNFINGEWVPSYSGKTFSMINPADQTPIGQAQQSNKADMEKAIAAADFAVRNSEWKLNSALRASALMELSRLVAENKERLARLYTRNNGKTINEARAELTGCADMAQYNAGMARNVFGRSIDPTKSALSLVVHEPVGVVGVISPWNWPVVLMFREMIPALAAGNAIVLKPASLTAAISMEVIELFSKVSAFPKGIVNAVTGSGQSVGEVLAASPKVNMISFTGDTSTGGRVAELAATKKITLELGGKSPNIVFDDADLDKVIPASIVAVFLTSGQLCMAGTRLIVQDTIFDETVRRMKEATEKLKVGNGLEERCRLGPLVSNDQLERVMRYIELGKKEGKLITGGYRLKGPEYDRGFFVAPTIFTDLPNNSRLVQEEIFGPVLVVQKFHTEAEAIELANGTKFGLASAVWTKDVNRAIRVAKAMEAGTVWINTYFKIYNQTEFGGYKASGIGRARGVDGLLEFTQLKHINFDINPTY
jgi:betaine-aldehyde dehydrogenase